MANPGQDQTRIFGISFRAITIMLTLTMVFPFAAVVTPLAQAQSYNVIYSFGDLSVSGGYPETAVSIDRAGNLYGTARGGIGSGGTLFKLSRKNSAWTFSVLHSFYEYDGNGYRPLSVPAPGPNGILYGTTTSGGGGNGCGGSGCGTLYSLQPPLTVCKAILCPWNHNLRYSFMGGPVDGDLPSGPLTFDADGAIYITTQIGGQYGNGAVIKLTSNGGAWSDEVLYSFTGGDDGNSPQSSGVIFDKSGNLFGTTFSGGEYGGGVVFQLTPSGNIWSETPLHSFHTYIEGVDGSNPSGGLVVDQSGNLFGTTSYGGDYGGGTVFELSPSAGGWTFSKLHDFVGQGQGPLGSLTIDAAGNLYGTTNGDGAYGQGCVFELTPTNGGWTYVDLHDFTGGLDGGSPNGGVVLDAAGNRYGTASLGGVNGLGAVWEVSLN
jgi:uncharacterized repeat protein (TIGR03803 family)